MSIALGVVSLALAGLSAWALTRDDAAVGPRVYDAGLPDSAVMAFAATMVTSSYGLPLRNLSVAPSGEFVVYTVQQGESATIWYRSLRDAVAHPIPGTAGGVAPRVSPDGQRIAFQKSGRVMVVPLAGGVARQLMHGTAVMSVEWISPTQLLVSDQDGYHLSWLDIDQGLVRSKPSQRCAFGSWILGERRLTCSLSMTGTVMDPDSNVSWVIRSTRSDGTPGPPLAGSDFRVVAGRYLLYVSVDGELRAAAALRARFDAQRDPDRRAQLRPAA